MKSPGSLSVTICRILPYEIHVGSGVLASLRSIVPAIDRAHRVAVITDSTVGPLYAEQVIATIGRERCTVVTIPPGEAHKTRETWARVTDALLAAQLGRDSLVVALGGGVVGDLAGFVAATYLRGIPVLQLPTTLLAMVDASIGGKTGVDTVHGKNLVGAFHPPVAVVADLDTLATLTPQQRSNGLAEALKHGVMADAGYFHRVASAGVASAGVASAGVASAGVASAGVASANIAAADWHDVVSGSVAIKAAVVHADERENGLRKTLNFGHTVGHALEHLLHYTVPHGECIAIGMMAETRIAIALGICDAALAPVLQDALHACALPTQVPSSLTVEAIVDATGNDKKSRAGIVEYALPARLGAMAGADREYGIPVDRETVLRALQRA